jgi:hypothetical protein
MVERSVALNGNNETDANERPLESSCKGTVSTEGIGYSLGAATMVRTETLVESIHALLKCTSALFNCSRLL